MTAGALIDAYAGGHLTPVEACEYFLKRIEQLDPVLHSFIQLDPAAVRRQAEAATAALRNDGLSLPLLGVPIAIKDMIDVAGVATTCHSRLRLDHIAGTDADCVARLRNAGAIIMGKLATHEFARGGPAFDLPFPPARNPWKTSHHPGGSSSGAGAGVAAELFPLALGTDTGGSVRHPAAACGVVGFKPSYDRVSRDGVFPLSPTLDHVGVLARTVEDVALAYEYMRVDGPSKARTTDYAAVPPFPTAGPALDHIRQALKQPVQGLRIGYLKHFHTTDVPASAEIAAGIDSAASVLQSLGVEVEETASRPLTDYFDVNRVILNAESWQIHQNWVRERPGEYASVTRSGILEGSFYTAADYLDAMRCRQLLATQLQDLFTRYDFLLCGNSLHPPCEIDDPARISASYSMQARTPFNLSGDPAIGLMCGVSADGLPLSFQLAAAKGHDFPLLNLASAYQAATLWHQLRPSF